MKLKVLRDFYDKKEKLKLRKAGEEFDADKTREQKTNRNSAEGCCCLLFSL